MGKWKGDEHLLHVIDFLNATRYLTPDGKHILPAENAHGAHRAPYASLASNKGQTTSRRDDMESIGYTLISLMTGRLPWDRTGGTAKVIKVKEASQMRICDELPKQFSLYMAHCRGLGFDAMPDYVYLRKLLRDLFEQNEYKMDQVYDWAAVLPVPVPVPVSVPMPGAAGQKPIMMPYSAVPIPVPMPQIKSIPPPAPKEKQATDTELCKVCMAGGRNALLLPCKHFGLCEGCAGKVKLCPFCQKSVESFVTVFPQ